VPAFGAMDELQAAYQDSSESESDVMEGCAESASNEPDMGGDKGFAVGGGLRSVIVCVDESLTGKEKMKAIQAVASHWQSPLQ
jgi:hypothetical protein